ncbi:outer membrane usher protein [Rhizobiales bacterium GAS113]|nr:outer membrane usher protein [Rhizobiales bacterium GAS113]
MRSRCSRPRASQLVIVTVMSIVMLRATHPVFADERRALQLEVYLRGQPTHLIAAFGQGSDGSLWARRSELEEVGLKVPPGFRIDEEVPLSDLPGVRYRYDELRQSVDFDVPDTRLLPKQYEATPQPDAGANVDRSSPGVVVNYTLFGAGGGTRLSDAQYQGASAKLDARAFGYFGVVSQSLLVTSNSVDTGLPAELRLDSSWSYSDPDTLITWRAGDTISGGLAWTRPIRLGGVQVERNFALRPDLVTLPLPNVSGSAAVPSTVDIYVNNVRAISQDVSSGPFRINNIPILTGDGAARIVVRDASGRATETTLPFFVSSQLLREGLFDFSAELGYPRLFYGSKSDAYAGTPAASASTRYGLTNHLTLEAHAEGTHGFANGGLGAILGLNGIGLFSAAASGSWQNGSMGAQAYAAYETQLFGISFNASTQRSFRNYADLASVTAQPLAIASQANQIASLQTYLTATTLYNPASLVPTFSVKPARALDRISVGLPLPFVAGALNFGYAHVKDEASGRSQIVNASYTRPIRDAGSFYLTVYADLDHHKNAGIFAGISLPLGQDVTASVGVSRDRSGLSVATDIAKPLQQEPGSYGWRLRDVEGNGGQQQRQASFGYRANQGQVQVTATQSRGGVAGTAQLDGAIVASGGGLFMTNRIDDAFAVVNAGAPHVDVLYENRVVAQTDASGRAIVPTLRAYQANAIAVDPRNLPINASIDTTRQVLKPSDRAGVVVDFGIRTQTHSAIVILQDGDGRPLQAGLRGSSDTGHAFFVGHDGRAFMTDLAAHNLVNVRRRDDSCAARFDYAPRGDTQVVIGPVTCR